MYLWLKLLHLFGVVMFVGNIVTGVFWHKHAERTRDPRLLAHAMNGIIRSDRLFTMPGVMLILAAGIVAAVVGGLPMLGTGWILWTIVLFAISGLVFMLRLAPLQRRLRAMAEAGAASGQFDFDGYRRLARQWDIWGTIATATPVAGIALMVLKPAI